MKSFGKRLRDLREMVGLSQSQLAKICCLTPAAICQLENEQREPTMLTVKKICQGLKVEVSYFYRDESKAETPDELSKAMVLRGVPQEDRETVEKFMQFLAHSKAR